MPQLLLAISPENSFQKGETAERELQTLKDARAHYPEAQSLLFLLSLDGFPVKSATAFKSCAPMSGPVRPVQAGLSNCL